MTLACEDDNSKLVEVVSVAHVDDEKRVDNSLVQIWKVKFGHKVKFLFRLWAQGFKVWSRFWSWCWGKILKLNFGHYFATDAWLWLWSSILVEILKLGLIKIFKFKFCRNADVWLMFWSWCLKHAFFNIFISYCKYKVSLTCLSQVLFLLFLFCFFLGDGQLKHINIYNNI